MFKKGMKLDSFASEASHVCQWKKIINVNEIRIFCEQSEPRLSYLNIDFESDFIILKLHRHAHIIIRNYVRENLIKTPQNMIKNTKLEFFGVCKCENYFFNSML